MMAKDYRKFGRKAAVVIDFNKARPDPSGRYLIFDFDINFAGKSQPTGAQQRELQNRVNAVVSYLQEISQSGFEPVDDVEEAHVILTSPRGDA